MAAPSNHGYNNFCPCPTAFPLMILFVAYSCCCNPMPLKCVSRLGRPSLSSSEPLPREVIAIDGKTVALGQQCVKEKSNEITAIPLLLDSLNLENSLVTLDAMGCQTKIAQHILNQKGDYLLVLKANHRHDYQTVKSHFLDESTPYPNANSFVSRL